MLNYKMLKREYFYFWNLDLKSNFMQNAITYTFLIKKVVNLTLLIC